MQDIPSESGNLSPHRGNLPDEQHRSCRSSKTSRAIRVAVVILLLGLAGGLAISWQTATWLVAPRQQAIGQPPSDLPFASVRIPSQSGSTLAGWHLRVENSRGVVVVVHGIYNSRLGMLRRARLLSDAGYSSLLIDLQAHGESPGKAITLGHLEQHDVRAAVEFAKRQHPLEKVAVVGVSLGGAAALLASPLGVDALIVESVFPRVGNAIHNRIPAKFGLLRPLAAELLLLQLPLRLGCWADSLCPIDHISTAGCPVFVISGADDQNTTESEAVELFNAAAEPKEHWLVPGAGHDDFSEKASEEYARRLVSFLESAMKPAGAR